MTWSAASRCKHCKTRLVKMEGRQKPSRQFFYRVYYKCPSCGSVFFNPEDRSDNDSSQDDRFKNMVMAEYSKLSPEQKEEAYHEVKILFDMWKEDA